jgi:pilus assembly protein Flp/PilA
VKEVNVVQANISRRLGALLALVRREDGQTFVEYSLLLVFIALVALLGATLVGDSISSLFVSVAGLL